MLKAKYEALKNYLVETGEATPKELTEELGAVYNEFLETFEILGHEYKVLTDEEADETAEDYIKDILWAFNADFIFLHSALLIQDSEEFIKALQKVQRKLCESANPIVKAIISDIDSFIDDAIDADGRGHFLSSWDGEEHRSGDFYIYRTN